MDVVPPPSEEQEGSNHSHVPFQYMAYIESQLSLLFLLLFFVSNLTAFSPSPKQGEGLGLVSFLCLAAVALLMASVAAAADVVLAIAASLDVLAIAAAAAVAAIVLGFLIF